MNGSVGPDLRPPTALETVLQSKRLAMGTLLVFVPVVSWAWIVVMARDMYGPMTGASAWMMTGHWDIPHLVLLWVMWAVMMTGMMLPSAAPLLLFYGVMARRSGETTATRQIYALAAGYVVAWAIFSVGATLLQRLLGAFLLLTPMMEPAGPWLAALLLVFAGAYQLTPLKLACLRTCRSPLTFLLSRWRGGTGGAFRMGAEHGAYCVGCCWVLMLLLFAGGVMNLAVIAALTALVAFEKLAPFGAHGARISGFLLVATGIWVLIG